MISITWLIIMASSVTNMKPRPPAAGGTAFDPSFYLQERVEADASKAQTIREHGIYRINGRRFHRLATSEGEVYLPGDGELPELMEEFAVCRQHLPLVEEVLEMRKSLPIEPKLAALGAQVVPLIHKCQEGKLRGPRLVLHRPDGAYLEVRAKKIDKRIGSGNGNGDGGEDASSEPSLPIRE